MEQVLNQLPKGWITAQVKDVTASLSSGFACNKNFETTDGYVHLRTHNISTSGCLNFDQIIKVSHEKIDEKKSKIFKGDILFNNTNSKELVGKTAYVDQDYDYAFSNHLTRIVTNDKVYSKFLVYWLVSLQTSGYFNQICKKWIGQAGVNNTVLKGLSVPLPNKEEQKRIVEKLDALLTRIYTSIEHLQENLVTSKSLLASALFERFHQEVNPTPIKDIFNVYNGRAYKKPELLDSGKYKVIRIQNLKGGENYYYSDLELDENKYCESGDLLFSWSGTPGTSFGAFIWNDEKAIYHYHIWKMEPKLEIAPRYAYWLLKDITEEAIANARGVAGMLHITKGTMESFVVSLPSYEAQQKIAKELDALALKSEQLQAEISSKIDSLKHLKASILDSAFKGEL
ncbi:restriction endonuclease subunit S [Alteromonas hispanica]|uniref:Type I restriction modification DNA specificity domain-containing protein n=1 Tax=Alteromonas hispanica TaxID=315421 RepID=A0A6L9MSK9_9ALTE|nr:restriction endonuclease subunit S [Alteromonas hispanica]NDW21204.1 hypothetical protein [Alteromonas hispanica]